MFKKERGITLVALVVTIVVLLILAGVSISLVLSKNGIVNKAKEAKNATANALTNDYVFLNDAETFMNDLMTDL